MLPRSAWALAPGLLTVVAQQQQGTTHDGVECASSLAALSADLNAACCSPLSNCAGGFPVQCSATCSDLWLPFRSDCHAYLRDKPELSELGRACYDAIVKQGDTTATDVVACPSGYHQFGDNCYLLSLDTATFDVAKAACEGLGGELACVNDTHEQDFITGLAAGADEYYWIGLHDRDAEGDFVWANKQCTSSYSNWLDGEPDDSGGGSAESAAADCVRMCAAEASGSCQPGRWVDDACPTEFHYICEVRGCPDGWTAHGGSCYDGFTQPPGSGTRAHGLLVGSTWAPGGGYWTVDHQKSWADASAACAALGATLVHIDDASENAWIASRLPHPGTDEAYFLERGLPAPGTDDYCALPAAHLHSHRAPAHACISSLHCERTAGIGARNRDTVGRTPASDIMWEVPHNR